MCKCPDDKMSNRNMDKWPDGKKVRDKYPQSYIRKVQIENGTTV